MNDKKGVCPVCKSCCEVYVDHHDDRVFRVCPVCGKYEITLSGYQITDDNHLPPYLFYNRYQKNRFSESTEYRYHTTLSKELCDKYKKEFEYGNIKHGHPVHMDADIIANWYPKSLAERIDRILCRIYELSEHIGKPVHFAFSELLSLLFVDRKQSKQFGRNATERDNDDCLQEAQYMIDVLNKQQLVEVRKTLDYYDGADFLLTPTGYARVDELQNNNSHGNTAFVAMQFGADTASLREAIRNGIKDSGYVPVFIDEVPHNEFITPEILKHIRDSKFVVVDLTHQNNGAYFEEGYAMGLGKPVIQLCQKDTKLHFDIAQKNTIIWATEEEIPLRLSNRIKATIE